MLLTRSLTARSVCPRLRACPRPRPCWATERCTLATPPLWQRQHRRAHSFSAARVTAPSKHGRLALRLAMRKTAEAQTVPTAVCVWLAAVLIWT